MNIETTNVNNPKNIATSNSHRANSDSEINFKDELKELENAKEETHCESNEEELVKVNEQENVVKEENAEKVDVDKAIKEISSVVEELNQSEEKSQFQIKKNDVLSDRLDVINNDFNISENKDKLPQMNPNMNFGGDGQPFSSFMNDQQGQKSTGGLSMNSKDLAEEAAILSTMAENIAMANKNKVITSNDAVKKVDNKSGEVIENIYNFDVVVMNRADVEVFSQLVKGENVNLNALTAESSKGVAVSRTLADLLAKSMMNNQPIRIDFDNDISVIIKISRDGKISADFLPSSQIAEAYLRENLPLLRQKFDDNNIQYEELNQKERKEQHKENNRKKGRNDE